MAIPRTAIPYEPFLTAMRGVFHPDSWLAALEMLLAGAMGAAANPKGGATILSRILVPVGQLEDVRERDHRLPDLDVAVSALTASKLLNVIPSVIGGAARLGLIETNKVGTRSEFPLSEVRMFGEKFVGSTEVAERTGLSPIRFSALARANGIQPVAQAYNNHIWLRTDIAALNLSRIK